MSQSVLNRAKLVATGYGKGSAFPIGNGAGARHVGNNAARNRAKNTYYDNSPTVNAAYKSSRVGDDGTTYDPNLAKVEVHEDTDTVYGQLKKHTDFNSPLMQRVAQQARDRAVSRGLGNTSIATGAATGAVVDQAGKFATADAQIYSNRRTENQRAHTQLESTAMSNRTSIVNTKSSNAARVSAANISARATLKAAEINAQAQKDAVMANNGFKASQARLDRSHQVLMADKSNAIKERLANLDANIRLDLANIQKETEMARQRNSALDSAWSSYMSGIAGINTNANAASQTNAYNRLKGSFEARMGFLNGGLSG